MKLNTKIISMLLAAAPAFTFAGSLWEVTIINWSPYVVTATVRHVDDNIGVCFYQYPQQGVAYTLNNDGGTVIFKGIQEDNDVGNCNFYGGEKRIVIDIKYGDGLAKQLLLVSNYGPIYMGVPASSGVPYLRTASFGNLPNPIKSKFGLTINTSSLRSNGGYVVPSSTDDQGNKLDLYTSGSKSRNSDRTYPTLTILSL